MKFMNTVEMENEIGENVHEFVMDLIEQLPELTKTYVKGYKKSYANMRNFDIEYREALVEFETALCEALVKNM